jgi:dienelactone hydrolase
MEGRSDAQAAFCHLLAEVGYKAVAVDLFGRAVTVAGADACAAAMDEFLKDRSALRDRIIGVTVTIRELPAIDPDAMAAIGFCFGGLCVLDAARHGVQLRAVGAFHGLLGPLPEPSDAPIQPEIAVYHGTVARVRACDARVHGDVRQRPRARHHVRPPRVAGPG